MKLLASVGYKILPQHFFVVKLIDGMRNGISRLGIDICLDTDRGHPYVIEANSVPGCDIAEPWTMSPMRAKYFKYLMKNYEE